MPREARVTGPRGPTAFDPTHLRPRISVRGEVWELLAYLRRDLDQGGYDLPAPDGTAIMCADYIEELEVAYGTEREMHNAWRKRAEEAEAALAALRGGPA